MSPPNLEALLPLVHRIQADPEGDHGLAALADQVGLSPSHLQRVFAAAVGESPKRLALRIVLERAAAGLVTTDAPVLSVALDAGFESHEGFTRAFRRHFGMSPTHYRRRGLSGVDPGSDAVAARHHDLATSAAPCVGLVRTTLATPRRTPTMSYEITRITLDETPFVYMSRRASMTEIGDVLGQLLPAVFAHVTKAGIAMAGPPTARYRDWGPGGGTLEAGIPVAPGSALGDDAGDIQLGSLPGGPAVTTVHVGPYDTIHQAHAAIEKVLAEEGLRCGDPWEVYLTDPGEVPDPAEWKTQVVTPIVG